nr:MAG TPA: hypothetical protein [Caudoviricetes sp.]
MYYLIKLPNCVDITENNDIINKKLADNGENLQNIAKDVKIIM